MKNLKNTLLLVLLTVVIFLLSIYGKGIYILAGINICFVSFNLIVRKSLKFKPYFLSKFNFFSANFNKEIIVELPADLVFEKILEVIDESGFKLVTADKEKLEILAVSQTSWKSWGENIYFSLVERNDLTTIHFDSAGLFAISTWGKNEDNYRAFFDNLEESFTI